MKRNCATTSNAWFIFFEIEMESNRVSHLPVSEALEPELVTTFSIDEAKNPDRNDSDGDNDGLAERGVDPARTRGVDPARTREVDPARTREVDPARTRQVDPARTRGGE